MRIIRLSFCDRQIALLTAEAVWTIGPMERMYVMPKLMGNRIALSAFVAILVDQDCPFRLFFGNCESSLKTAQLFLADLVNIYSLRDISDRHHHGIVWKLIQNCLCEPLRIAPSIINFHAVNLYHLPPFGG